MADLVEGLGSRFDQDMGSTEEDVFNELLAR